MKTRAGQVTVSLVTLIVGGVLGIFASFVIAMFFMIVTRGPDDTVASWADGPWRAGFLWFLAYVLPVVLTLAGAVCGGMLAWRSYPPDRSRPDDPGSIDAERDLS